MYGCVISLKKCSKRWYKQFISLKGDPGAIAAGLAIGVFIGVTPTIPLHTILIITICFLFKKNMTAGYLGSWVISNPLTIPFFYVFEYRLGKCLLGNSYNRPIINDYSLFSIMQMGRDVVVPLLTGGIIIAPFFAAPAYFIAYKLILSVREKRHDHGKKNT
jgi:uncharacterized protein (DUF2062 family)